MVIAEYDLPTASHTGRLSRPLLDQSTMIQADTTPHGADAHRALAAEIARLKGSDPLRPVSVVVSSNPIGIAARRALGHAGGIAVTFLTPYRLLNSSALRRSPPPDGGPLHPGARRRSASGAGRRPGALGGVASTRPPSARSCAHTGPCPRSHRTRTPRYHPRTADVVHRAVSERLRPRFSNEQDLVRAVVCRPDLTLCSPISAPRSSSSAPLAGQAHLLRAIAEHHHLGNREITGSAEADWPSSDRSSRSAVRGRVAPPSSPPSPIMRSASPTPTTRSATGLRLVVDAARRGTPLGRIAVLYGTRIRTLD